MSQTTYTSAIAGIAAGTPAASHVAGASASQSDLFTQSINQKLKVPANLEPYFAEASQKYQVPPALLKSVAKAESEFNPNAVSSAGAKGIMQLMPATARYLGVSDVFDARDNIMGGAKYLREMLDRYDGNTKLALAAYNAGCNNVDKYGGVPPFKETQNYVVKVMNYASDQLSTLPARGSYNSTPVQNYSPTYTGSSVTGSNDLAYQNILQSILNFDNFSTDDYLLFLEIIKSNMRMPAIDSESNSNDSTYQNLLMQNRIQTLF